MLLLALHCIKSLRIWPDYPILIVEVVIFFIGFFSTLCNTNAEVPEGPRLDPCRATRLTRLWKPDGSEVSLALLAGVE